MAFLAGALGRDMAQAPASPSKPIADLLFILSADMVSLIFFSSCTLPCFLTCSARRACHAIRARLMPSAHAQATFTDANTLILANASSTAQYYGKGEPLLTLSQ